MYQLQVGGFEPTLIRSQSRALRQADKHARQGRIAKVFKITAEGARLIAWRMPVSS